MVRLSLHGQLRRGCSAPAGLLLLATLLLHSGGAGAVLALHAGPESVRTDRWRHLVAEVSGTVGGSSEAILELRRLSGHLDRRTLPLQALAAIRHEEYFYAGHPDPVVAAELRLGAEVARWQLPAAIPPERVLLVASQHPAWASRVAAALAEPGVGVEQRSVAALPGHWLALRGLAAVAVDVTDLPRAGAGAPEALRRYALHGGLVLLLVATPSTVSTMPWSGVGEQGVYGRGRVLPWSPEQGELPRLAGWPAPPVGSRPLPLARQDAWPPVGWLVGRFLAWLLLAGLACALLRRRPLPATALLLVLLLLGVAAPPYPAPEAPILQSTVWQAPDDGTDDGSGSRWVELRALPRRSGRIELALPAADRATVLVGLHPAGELALERTGEPLRWQVQGRWGEPVDLLLEDDRTVR